MERQHFFILAALFVFLGKDLMMNLGGGLFESEAPVVDVKRGRDVTHVAYCTSWSYKGTYMQVAQLLQQQYPGMQVVGSNYPTGRARQLAAQALSVAQFSLLGSIFMGEKLFEALGYAQPPEFYRAVAGNKFGAAMGVWFVGNALSSSLVSTGAFEIYYDGELVFSKLAQGRLPTRDELLVAMDEAIAAQPPLEAAAAAAGAAGGVDGTSSDAGSDSDGGRASGSGGEEL